MQHPGTIKLRIVVGGCIDLTFRFVFPRSRHFHDQLLIHSQISQMRFHHTRLQSQQLARLPQKNTFRQKAVPLRTRQHQSIEDPAPDPIIRIRMDPDPGSDLICDLESYPLDILCKLIWIFLKNPIKSRTIGLINTKSKCIGYAILLQVGHGFSGIPLLIYHGRDLSCLALTDPFDLRQPLRFFLNDPVSICPEPFHDPGCQRLSHTLDGPRSQIPLYADHIIRRYDLVLFYFELFTVYRMGRKIALCLYSLPLIHRPEKADTSGLIFSYQQVQDCITVCRIAVYNMFHKSLDDIHLL